MFQSTQKTEQSQKQNTDLASKGLGLSYAELMRGQEIAANVGAPAQMMGDEEDEPMLQVKAIQKAPKEEEMQMKASSKNASDSAQITGTSTSMPENVQAKMENSFGTSFGGVNIQQNDSGATQMGALAYTQGSNVHFAPGNTNLIPPKVKNY